MGVAQKIIEHDSEMAEEFLLAFGEKHCLQLLPENRAMGCGRPHTRWGTFKEYSYALEQGNLKGHGVFFVVNECKGDKRSAQNVTRIRAVCVDLDGAPLEPVLQGPLEPHLIVETSPGRYHVYWLVEGVPLDLFRAIQKRLAEHYDGDPAVCDLSRLMRVPGFFHNKGEPFLSRVIEYNNIPRYRLLDLEKGYGGFHSQVAEIRTGEKGVRIEDFRPQLSELPKPDIERIRTACGFVEHCIADAHNLSELKWWILITIVVHCKGGEVLAHQVSAPYPGYSEEETDYKIQQALKHGKPHTCEYIEKNTSGVFCSTCPHKDSVKSPITLGYDGSQRSLDDVPPEIAKLNERHALVMLGGKAVILNEELGLDSRLVISFSTAADFRTRYNNKTFMVPSQGKLKKVRLGDYWIDSAHRRQYDSLAFAPGQQTPSNVYNLYKGLAIVPRKGKWSKMRRHLFRVIADGDSKVFRYLLAYFARMVQDPGGERPGVALVLIGDQGTGKGELLRNLGKFFGSHFLHITSQQQLVGRFNSHLMRTILLYVDEGFWAGDKGAEGVLKGLITEPTIAVEPKGKDLFTVANHINLIMSSNNDWVVPAGLEERRFLVLRVSNCHRQDHAYFKALREEMDNGGSEAMLHYLLNMDLSGINLRQVPRTQALLQQIVQSLDSVGKFWTETLQEGALPKSRGFLQALPDSIDIEWGTWISKEIVYLAYTSFCADLGIRRPETKGSFTRTLKKLCPSVRDQRATKADKDGHRPTGYIIPSLDICRHEFESAVSIEVPWDD